MHVSFILIKDTEFEHLMQGATTVYIDIGVIILFVVSYMTVLFKSATEGRKRPSKNRTMLFKKLIFISVYIALSIRDFLRRWMGRKL